MFISHMCSLSEKINAFSAIALGYLYLCNTHVTKQNIEKNKLTPRRRIERLNLCSKSKKQKIKKVIKETKLFDGMHSSTIATTKCNNNINNVVGTLVLWYIHSALVA